MRDENIGIRRDFTGPDVFIDWVLERMFGTADVRNVGAAEDADAAAGGGRQVEEARGVLEVVDVTPGYGSGLGGLGEGLAAFGI